MPQSPEAMAASMVENLEANTGKTLDEWLTQLKGGSFSKHGEVVKHLKAEHGVTHGYANLIAHKLLKSDAASVGGHDALVEAQFSGPKAGLRPIYDAVMERVRALGGDVEIAPKKAYVSLRRNKQFAIVQPSTKTRVDVGINLKGTAPTARLEASGSFNAMVSHRVRLTDVRDVDSELEDWLREAYERA